MLSRCGHFPFGFLVRFNCARNSRVDYLSRPEGCEMTAEGLEPDHEYCTSCGCIMSLTSSPWAPISCVPAFSSLQAGLARCVLRLL